jgi:hypothetical protein
MSSGIFCGDVIIKAAIDRGLDDLRKNPWLIRHAFSSLLATPYIADKYGKKQVEAVTEWFLNNRVDIYMRPRNDKDILPCVTITPGSCPEIPDMKHMADLSTETVILMPLEIGRPIPFVVKPFTPLSYDSSTGEVGIDITLPGFSSISPGMILVNPSTGEGYKILEVTSGILTIEADLNIDATQLAVVPQYAYYEARVEHTFFQDNYVITPEAHGDPQTLIWLHTLVMYSILRYRESLLEANGFTQSSVSSGEIMEDPNYTGEEIAYIRPIYLTGMVRNSWIKLPRRFIETVAIQEVECNETIGGIQIISNEETPPIIDPTQNVWFTSEDED